MKKIKIKSWEDMKDRCSDLNRKSEDLYLKTKSNYKYHLEPTYERYYGADIFFIEVELYSDDFISMISYYDESHNVYFKNLKIASIIKNILYSEKYKSIIIQ